MKRFFAIFVAGAMLLAATTTATAQQGGDWQVRGSAGVLSLPDVFGVIVVGFGSIDTSENVTSHEFVPLTSPTVEVNYWLGDKLALGGSL
jgi:zinc transporter ZupT